METNQMIIEKVSPWNFEKTVELLTSEAEKRDWKIPAIHDLQQSLAKAGKAVNSVKVLEYVNLRSRVKCLRRMTKGSFL